jgi:hypothetical protein
MISRNVATSPLTVTVSADGLYAKFRRVDYGSPLIRRDELTRLAPHSAYVHN